jgi:hypothetical protein
MTQNTDYFNKVESIFNANTRLNPNNSSKLPVINLEDNGLNKLYDLSAGSKLNKIKFKYLYKLTSLDYLNTSTPLHTEEFFYKPSFFNLLNFSLYNNESSLDTLDDNYENLKNFKNVYTGIYQNLYMNSFKYVSPMTYTAVLDAYRANYDEYN